MIQIRKYRILHIGTYICKYNVIQCQLRCSSSRRCQLHASYHHDYATEETQPSYHLSSVSLSVREVISRFLEGKGTRRDGGNARIDQNGDFSEELMAQVRDSCYIRKLSRHWLTRGRQKRGWLAGWSATKGNADISLKISGDDSHGRRKSSIGTARE